MPTAIKLVESVAVKWRVGLHRWIHSILNISMPDSPLLYILWTSGATVGLEGATSTSKMLQLMKARNEFRPDRPGTKGISSAPGESHAVTSGHNRRCIRRCTKSWLASQVGGHHQIESHLPKHSKPRWQCEPCAFCHRRFDNLGPLASKNPKFMWEDSGSWGISTALNGKGPCKKGTETGARCKNHRSKHSGNCWSCSEEQRQLDADGHEL